MSAPSEQRFFPDLIRLEDEVSGRNLTEAHLSPPTHQARRISVLWRHPVTDSQLRDICSPAPNPPCYVLHLRLVPASWVSLPSYPRFVSLAASASPGTARPAHPLRWLVHGVCRQRIITSTNPLPRGNQPASRGCASPGAWYLRSAAGNFPRYRLVSSISIPTYQGFPGRSHLPVLSWLSISTCTSRHHQLPPMASPEARDSSGWRRRQQSACRTSVCACSSRFPCLSVEICTRLASAR